jgi:hypothetical protein
VRSSDPQPRHRAFGRIWKSSKRALPQIGQAAAVDVKTVILKP